MEGQEADLVPQGNLALNRAIQGNRVLGGEMDKCIESLIK